MKQTKKFRSASSAFVLVLGTAEWDQAIATNQHYVVREMCERFDVIYVESMGLRTPKFNSNDISRVMGKLTRKSRGQYSPRRAVPDKLTIISPIVIPYHRGPVRLINTLFLNFQLRKWRNSAPNRILWTYTPVTYGLHNTSTLTVYHCVDLLREVEGISPDIIDSNEAELACKGVQAIGSSTKVTNHLEEVGFQMPLYWPNVGDLDVFRKNGIGTRTNAALFAGNLTSQKVDFELIQQLVHAGLDVHLAGPIAEGSTKQAVEKLTQQGVKYHGLLNLEQLAKLANNCRVGLIPYLQTPYTTGVSPLKTYEYLAAGLTVISTAMPGVKPIQSAVRVTNSNQEFVREALDAIASPNSPEMNSTLSDGHGWNERGQLIRDLVSRGLKE